MEGGGGEGFRGGGAGMEGVAPRFGGGYGSALAHGGRGAGRKGGSVGVSEGEGAVDGVGGRGRGEGDMTQGMPLTPPDVFTFSAQQGPFKGLAPRGLTPQKHVGGAGGRGERTRSRSLSRNVLRPPHRANPLSPYEFHVHYDDRHHDDRHDGHYAQYMHDQDTDTVRAYLRHPLLDFPPTPLHTLSSLASYRRLGFYDDSERRDGVRQAVVVQGSPPAADDGAEGGSAPPGGLHGLYPEMNLEPAAAVQPVNHLADDRARVSSDVPGRHIVAGEGGHVRSRFISARRTSSANSSVLDHTSHLETQRDTETKGRGLRRAASERSFRGPAVAAAARGASLEGGSGGGQMQALEPQLPPPQLAHASPKGDFDLRLYPASTSHPAPLSAPHSSTHSAPHTPVPHSAHVGVAPTPTQRPQSAGGGETP